MSKKNQKKLPKIIIAFIQIGIVILAVLLFSCINYFFILKNDTTFYKSIAPTDIKFQWQYNAKVKKKSVKKNKKSKNKKRKKNPKVEIAKIDDKILSDLLTPLPNGSTKIQLYAETLDSKVGPITYFNQSDYRWAKHKYGKGSPMYSSGCGPTTMAMIINTFKPEQYVTPDKIADFAYSKGCYIKGGGSTHDIVRKCASEYDIPVKVIKATKDNIKNALENKKLLVALVGKGEFTDGGHFILINGINSDDKINIADSINLDNTHKKWDIDFIISQLKKSVSAGPLWELG